MKEETLLQRQEAQCHQLSGIVIGKLKMEKYVQDDVWEIKAGTGRSWKRTSARNSFMRVTIQRSF